jgi:hypothetical protein
MNKRDVINSHIARRNARIQLLESSKHAKVQFAPKAVINRWKVRQKAKLLNTKKDALLLAKDNAGLIGVLGIGIIIAASWKPLNSWFSKWKYDQKTKVIDDEE